MKRAILFITLMGTAYAVLGQATWLARRDSLLRALSRQKEDTNKVWTLMWLGVGYIDNQPDSALYYAKAMGGLSAKLHFPLGSATGLSVQAVIASNHDKSDEAIALDLEAIEIVKKTGRLRTLANFYNNTAIAYGNKGDMESALTLYLEAAAIYEQLADSSSTAFIYSNIASVYTSLQEYEKCYNYALKGISLCRSLHQTHGLGAGMVNLASALICLKRYDTALIVMNQTLGLARAMDDKNEEMTTLTNMNFAYEAMGQYNLIPPNAETQMSLAKSMGSQFGFCYGLLGMTSYWVHERNYAKARTCAHQAIDLSGKNALTPVLRDSYKEAAGVELAAGDLQRYHYFDDLRDSLDNVLLSDKILKNTQELDAKYSLNQKQTQIDALNKQQRIEQLTLRQRRTLNWVMAGAVAMILLIVLLYLMNDRQKKKFLQADALLQQKRIDELEKEKQLLATQAALQGQVEERTRLAKDLHDGLGSMLSGAKYSFAHTREMLTTSTDQAAAFEKSMGMLDTSIRELRRVAHNMMPEALAKFGLDTALRDFCNSIDQSGDIRLTYQSFDIDEASIPKTTASAVYRIVQELVNNIIRHAEATTALVQLVRNKGSLSITVEDNGKGFDKDILQKSSGIGYLNLQNRIAYLNGTIDIQTAEGKGTSVNIELSNLEV